MPDDITREARDLCKRATPGPWEVFTSIDAVKNIVDYFVQQVHGHPQYRINVKAYGKQASADDAEFIARSRTLVPELLDLLAAKDAEIARLTAERDAIKQSCDGLCASHDNVYARLTAMAARAEKAEVERDAAVDERDTLMRRHAKQVEVIRHKIDDGGFSPDEQSLLDDLMLPRHFDRRGTEG